MLAAGNRKPVAAKWRMLMLLVLCGVLFEGCSTIGFVAQSARGHIGVATKRRAIEKVVARPDTDSALAERLGLVLDIRRFATEVMALPDNGSYRSYVELDRPYVVWNVVAAPEFSTRPLEWCFPVAGCVSYRGYFSHAAADRFGERLRQRGYDVSVAGVVAYSTLGWFKDPVISTFVDWPEPQLAGLIFHELTHQKLYLKGDTVFNESLATMVETVGVRRWLRQQGRSDLETEENRRRERQEEFVALVLAYRERLDELYSRAIDERHKRLHKELVIKDLRAAYRSLKDSRWQGYAGYDSWFSRPLNNAQLSSVGSYHDLVGGFEALLERSCGDLGVFFSEARKLGRLDLEDRRGLLIELDENSPGSATQRRIGDDWEGCSDPTSSVP